MSDKRVAKPGIKTTKPKRVGEWEFFGDRTAPSLGDLSRAFDDMAKRSVSVKRRGLKRLVRKLAYFVLART
jgi:hypothetical protein